MSVDQPEDTPAAIANRHAFANAVEVVLNAQDSYLKGEVQHEEPSSVVLEALCILGGLQQLLDRSNANGVFDRITVLRTMDVGFVRWALAAARAKHGSKPAIRVKVVTAPNDLPAEASVVCLDLEQIVDIRNAITWAEQHGSALRSAGHLLIAAVGRAGADLTDLVEKVDGIITRPKFPSPHAWVESVMPIWTEFNNPNLVDTVPPEQLQGGVSKQEFQERLDQAISALGKTLK